MAKTSTKTVEAKTFKTAISLRKGLRAYVGMYSAAYDRIQPVLTKAGQNYDAYAVKGEALELAAQSYAKGARGRAAKSYDVVVSKVRSALPNSANDRVAELEAEVATLNKKLVTATKKVTKKTVKTAKKTISKTVAPTAKATVDAVAEKAEKVAQAIKAA